MYPLKIFVIFLHEASHALTALLTGGQVLELSLSPQQGGHVKAAGGNGFLIASSGYLGSLFWGAALFLLGLRTRLDKVVVGMMGALMLGITALYIRDLFPLAFCILTGLGLLLSAYFLSQPINDLWLRVMGLASMIYVPYDIFSDTLARSHLVSDARILAENYGGTTMLWGGIWLFISMVFLLFIARQSLKSPSNIDFASTKPGKKINPQK